MMKQTISLTHVPTSISNEILQACKYFENSGDPVFVNRLPYPAGTINKCTYNVLQYLASNPGEILLGWDICIWDSVLIQCIGHAIVKNGENLFCVTPSKYSDSRLLFLPDPNLKFDFSNPNERMPSVMIPISSRPEVLRFIEIDRLEYSIKCKYPVMQGNIMVHGADAAELIRISGEKKKILASLLNMKK